jgi:protein-tyrosine phosphatase
MSIQGQRHLLWDSCYNIREMGGFVTNLGGMTRFRAFIRADNLARLSEDGQEALIQYGVGTIIDLRSAYELEIDPPPFAQSNNQHNYPRYINTPFLNEDDEEGMEKLNHIKSLTASYHWMLDRFQTNIGMVMTQIANATGEGPILFHCHSGRDRTGIVAAFLLLLAGVDKQIVAEDYALSSEYIQPTFTEILYKEPEVMLETIEYLEQKYGGVSSYLLLAGMTKQDLQQLVSHLTD